MRGFGHRGGGGGGRGAGGGAGGAGGQESSWEARGGRPTGVGEERPACRLPSLAVRARQEHGLHSSGRETSFPPRRPPNSPSDMMTIPLITRRAACRRPLTPAPLEKPRAGTLPHPRSRGPLAPWEQSHAMTKQHRGMEHPRCGHSSGPPRLQSPAGYS